LDEALEHAEDKPVILVKGSRSMRMERVVQALVDDRSVERNEVGGYE
jgi:UDP-N-acetylmuramyl pentapeptide synthase